MNSRKYFRIIPIGAFGLCLLRTELARADFASLECDALKLTPAYWVLYGLIEQAKQDGTINSKDSCTQLGDTLKDLRVPDGTYKDCLCKAIFGTGTAKPTCPSAHNVCTEGSPLAPNVMSDTTCTPTGSERVAADVCQLDPYCCNTYWDMTCVQEVSNDYWLIASGYLANAINNPQPCPPPDGPISDPALYLQECPGGNESPSEMASIAMGTISQTTDAIRSSDALCLSSPTNIALAGEYSDGDFDFAGTDWDQGYLKGQCAIGFMQLGLSVDGGGAPHDVLCEWSDANRFTGQLAAGLYVGSDDRRAYRSAGGATDWDAGYWKLECGNNEYIYASSQDVDTHEVHGVACAASTGLSSSACRTVSFDNSLGANVGDWDPNYLKAECTSGEYLAGVSVDPYTSLPHELLCCTR